MKNDWSMYILMFAKRFCNVWGLGYSSFGWKTRNLGQANTDVKATSRRNIWHQENLVRVWTRLSCVAWSDPPQGMVYETSCSVNPLTVPRRDYYRPSENYSRGRGSVNTKLAWEWPAWRWPCAAAGKWDQLAYSDSFIFSMGFIFSVFCWVVIGPN